MDMSTPRGDPEEGTPSVSALPSSSRFSVATSESLSARQEVLTWYGVDPTSHTMRDERICAENLTEKRRQVNDAPLPSALYPRSALCRPLLSARCATAPSSLFTRLARLRLRPRLELPAPNEPHSKEANGSNT